MGNGSSCTVPPQVPQPIINRCPECEQEIDVSELSPFAKTVCPHCDQSIRVRTSLGVYQLKRLLGQGGMSQVFLAVDTTLNREVALKVLHRSLMENAGLAAMFEREAKLTASINHSNVVRVYTVGQDQGNFFIAMEVVDNVSLEEKINGQGSVPEAEVLEIAYDVTLGLRAAFQAGLIHRDIKPGNILLTREGSAKLVDFGLALAHGGEDEVEDVWATPFYVPPEKLDGEQDDFRGDIYSLGATLFHAVAGVPPFDANTASMQELKEIKAQPLQLKDAAPHASAKLAKLIDKMMSFKPAKRHQSYEELVAEIDGLLEALVSITGSAGRSGKRIGDRRRSKKATTRLFAVGILVAAVALAIGLFVMNSGSDGGKISTPMLSAGGERVLGGGANAGQLFQQAREDLIGGKFESAHSQFAKLLSSEDLKQPTLSWTKFNAALSLLLQGEEPAARALFAELKEPSGFPEDDGSASLREFFQRIGNIAGDPLPAMPETREQFSSDSIDCLGLLVCGLKNWSAGEFDSGVEFLSGFLAASPPDSHSWITTYQPLAQPFVDDLQVIRSLPRPERDLGPAELAEMQKKLTLALEQLKTEGAGRTLARSRLERAKKFLAEPPPTVVATLTPAMPVAGGNSGGPDPSATVPVEEISEAASTELNGVRQVLSEVSALGAQYRFAEVAARWDQVVGSYQSPQAKRASGLELEACWHAEEFVRGVTTWLAGGKFEGVVRRREGRPLDAKITGADRESITIDLGFGPNRLAVEELDPLWLLETARNEIMTGPDATVEADPENWARVVWFARQTGLMGEAAVLAGELSVFSEPFKKSWDTLEAVRVGGSGDAGGGAAAGVPSLFGTPEAGATMEPGGPASLGGSIFKAKTDGD